MAETITIRFNVALVSSLTISSCSTIQVCLKINDCSALFFLNNLHKLFSNEKLRLTQKIEMIWNNSLLPLDVGVVQSFPGSASPATRSWLSYFEILCIS